MHSVEPAKHYPEQSSRMAYESLGGNSYPLDKLLWLIVGFGIALRLAQFLHNPSLWVDEAMLVINFTTRSLPELLTHPLEYNQQAPIGFLIAQKLFVEIFGGSEYALRLFPLICGITSVVLFPKVARGALSTPAALIVATTLFAVSYRLIFYAADAKQYSGDVAVALLLYLVTNHVLKSGFNARRSLELGVIGALAIWFSHPATFILAGIGMSLGWMFARQKAWLSLRSLIMALMLWAISFAASYFLSLRQLGRNAPLLTYWADSFMPFPPKTLSDLKWFDETFFNFFRDPLGLFPATIAGVTFVIGCLSLALHRKDQFLFLATPVLFTLLASGLHAYPFGERLVLFAVPFAIIAIAQGTVMVGALGPNPRKWTAAVALVFIVPQTIYSSVVFFRPFSFEEAKPAIAYARERWQPGDLVYVYHAAGPAFRYYAERWGFTTADYVLGQATRSDLEGFKAELRTSHIHRRLWVLFAHIDRRNGIDDDSLFRAQLVPAQQVADSFKARGSAVYLYVNAAH